MEELFMKNEKEPEYTIVADRYPKIGRIAHLVKNCFDSVRVSEGGGVSVDPGEIEDSPQYKAFTKFVKETLEQNQRQAANSNNSHSENLSQAK